MTHSIPLVERSMGASDSELRYELEGLRRTLLSSLAVCTAILSWGWFTYVLLTRDSPAIAEIAVAICWTVTVMIWRFRDEDLDTSCRLLTFTLIACFGLILVQCPNCALPVGVFVVLANRALHRGLEAALWLVVFLLATYLARGIALGQGIELDSAGRWYFAYLLCHLVSIIVTAPQNSSVKWMLNAWYDAIYAIRETRERRGELYRALRGLEEATFRIERMNNQLIIAQREAEEARAIKAKLAATVSHELRGPLNLILGFSKLMALSPESYDEPLPASHRTDIYTIYRNSQHLSALIDDILDLSQIQAQRLPLVRDTIWLNQDVVQHVAESIRPLLERKKISLEIDLEPDLQPILADPVRLRQALLNLLTNAARFTQVGSVSVSTASHDGMQWIAVQDTGPGISGEDIKELFQEFRQVHQTRTREEGGSGLGLAISKHLIELHGGSIAVESTLGEGTTFTFSVPETFQHEASAGTLRTRHHLQVDRPTCLVVHDDPDIVRRLGRYIEDFHMAGAPGVEHASALLDTLAPSAVITGHEYAEPMKLALAKAECSIPVIACELPRPMEHPTTRNVVGYLVKPVSADLLIALLRKIDREEGTHVLIVDDDPDAVRMLERMLLSLPRRYTIAKAYNGDQAMANLEAKKPDVVLLDWLMPNMGGGEVLIQMNESRVLRDIPVIIVSASDWLDNQSLISGSMTLYLGHPIDMGAAAGCIEAFIAATGGVGKLPVERNHGKG